VIVTKFNGERLPGWNGRDRHHDRGAYKHEGTAMVTARIHQGRIEVEDPIPKDWEGIAVKILPMTPDDPTTDLEERLVALQTLGPMEYETGECETIGQAMKELDGQSRDAMLKITDGQP
jgi:hypothetical protein